MTQAKADAASPARLVAAFAAIYVFWGATFLAIRYAVAELPPLLTMAVRCAGGAVVLYALVLTRERSKGRKAAA